MLKNMGFKCLHPISSRKFKMAADIICFAYSLGGNGVIINLQRETVMPWTFSATLSQIFRVYDNDAEILSFNKIINIATHFFLL